MDFMNRLHTASVKGVVLILLILVEGRISLLFTNLTSSTIASVFTSVNYPDNYPDSEVHYWCITAQEPSDKISITVLDSQIEYGKDCQHDYLRIYDGQSDRQLRIGVFCGEGHPTYQSTGRHIFLKFKSDTSKSYRGFKIEYQSVTTQSQGLTFSTKAVICSVMGLLCTFLLFALGNYFLRTARKSAGVRRRVRRRSTGNRTMTSVLYSISHSGQTIVSVENGTRIHRSASGNIVPDDPSFVQYDPSSLSADNFLPDYHSLETMSDPSHLGSTTSGFSMVLNVQELRLAPPPYESVQGEDMSASGCAVDEPPPAYDSVRLTANGDRPSLHRSLSLPSCSINL